MPTYAVLGATGNTGQSLLQILSQDSTNTIHAYCRSKSKLERLSPTIVSAPNVHVFEGSLSDTDLIAKCIENTHAIFLAVAIPNNAPNITIAQETAHVVVQALRHIQKRQPSQKLPKIVVLSSVAMDDYLCRDMPSFARGIILRAESGVYSDLIAAERFLRKHEDWLSVTFVKPGALCHDAQKGHELSIHTMNSPVSFLDLAAGMVEIANSHDVYDWKNVSVNPTAKDVAIPWGNVWMIFKGLLIHYFPWLYRWLG